MPRPPGPQRVLHAKGRPKAKNRTTRWWVCAIGAAVYLAFQAYAPALHGPYVFDDLDLPYHLEGLPGGLGHWISGTRPLLLLSYGVNYQFSREPFGFHVTNVAIHLINCVLVFFIMRELLSRKS